MMNKPNFLEKLLFAAAASTLAGSAFARLTPVLPEPSMLSLIGVGVAAGIVIYRINRKK